MAALAACGGGGGDDGGGNSSTGGNTGGNGGSGSQTSYTVTPSASGGGSISPSAPVTVQPGGTASFTLTPNAGYVPTVSGSCTGAFTSSTVYTTKAITGNCTVVASFVPTNQTYTVTPSVTGSGGSINPNSSVTVKSGATATFTLAPNAGYSASVAGTCNGTQNGNTYTTKPVTSNCTVLASFVLTSQSYTVTPSVSGGGGSISPNTAVLVQSGKTTAFTLTPNSGYAISGVGGSCKGSLSGSTYTTQAITGNCFVVASFAATSQSFTVTPSVSGGGGSISPNTPVTVKSGATATFTLAPNAGYTPSVGGNCTGTLSGNIYTTNPVTGNCTVVATFTANTKPLTFIYESQSTPSFPISPANLLALLNQEGTKGYLYQDPWGIGTFSLDGLTFANDGTGQTYSYELLAVPNSMADLITQANAEGAKGYHYEVYLLSSQFTTKTTYLLYRKDSGSTATYTYLADPVPASAADLLTQANGRGQSGYWLQWNNPLFGNGILYIKNNASNATYTYETLTWPATFNDLLAQFTTEGAKGYRVLFQGFMPAWNATVYIKDQTQTATFTYQLVTDSSSVPAIDQINSYGAQGYAFWGTVFPFYYSPAGHFYIKASNCKGFLCTILNPAVLAAPPATTGST